jgi:hypothetical protein
LKYHTVEIFPKFNRKIVERGKIQTLLQSKTLKKKEEYMIAHFPGLIQALQVGFAYSSYPLKIV